MKKVTNKDKFINYLKKHNKLSCYLVVLIIGTFFSLWLLKPGLLNGHDMTYHISRIKGIKDSIMIGDFRALIHSGLYGYGYANGLFYGNLMFYIPALFALKGINLINAYKIYLLICTMGSALTMYWCMNGITKNSKIGLIASFLYSACSYKMCDFIVRGAAGEMGAFVFVPLIMLGFYKIVYDDYKKWWIFSIGFVGLIQCHLISTILMFILSVVMILVNYERFLREKQRIFYLLLSGIVGLSIGAHFIFPLLQGIMKNQMVINLNSFPTWDYAVPFEKLFLGFPYWGWDKSSFLPAGIGIIFIVISLFRFKIKVNKNDILMKFCDLSIIMAYSTLFCATDLFPWKELEFLQSIQFPWRLYLFSSMFFAICDSIIVYYYLKNKTKKEKIKFLIPVILIAILPYLITEYYYRRHSSGIFYNYDDYSVACGEYLPQGTDIKQLKKRGDIVTSNHTIDIDYRREKGKIIVNYSNNYYDDSTYIEVPLLYYYGYYAYDENNQQYDVQKGQNNIVTVLLPKESGTMTIYYKGTIIQKLSLWVSIISTLLLIIYIFRSKLKVIKNFLRK